MRLYIKEKFFSLHNKYYVKNEQNQDILEISSKVISFGTKTRINKMDGTKLAYVEQELFHLMPNYNIIINNQKVCSIKKKFSFFKNNYELTNNYRVEGSFINHEFIVYNSQNIKVGEINRKIFTIKDQYIIDIYDENDYLLILSIIVAITNDVDRAQASSVSNN